MRLPAFFLLAFSLVLVCMVSLCLGAVKIPVGDVVTILGEKCFGRSSAGLSFEGVLWELRVPRVLLGMLVGSALSVAGALMQGLFRNPLVEPGLVGVSSGAALGVVLVTIFGSAFFPGHGWAGDLRIIPVAAFTGALAVTLFTRRLAVHNGATAVTMLLLAGIAVNAIVGAVIGLGTFLATDAQLRTFSFWTLGSLGLASWKTVAIAAPFCLSMVFIAPFFAPALNALALGEAEAGHLGFATERIKNLLVVLVAAGVGVCVAFTGIVGFVGLVTPHLIRLWLGPNHRWLIPAAALLGAILLTAADTLARTIAAPAELPIGILTSAFGGPFFLFMLLRQRRKILWA